jgi:hypothetical protein
MTSESALFHKSVYYNITYQINKDIILGEKKEEIDGVIQKLKSDAGEAHDPCPFPPDIILVLALYSIQSPLRLSHVSPKPAVAPDSAQ